MHTYRGFFLENTVLAKYPNMYKILIFYDPLVILNVQNVLITLLITLVRSVYRT